MQSYNINYSAPTLLVMQTAVIARQFLSVRPFVCLFVTFRCFVYRNEDMIVQFTASVGSSF